MLVNREKLAEVLGCSLRTVDEYRRQGMPGDAPKKPGDQWRFDSGAVVEWLREKERVNALGEIAQIDEGEAKRRKLAAEAAMAELELAKAEGSAVSVPDVATSWASMIGAARSKLLGLGSKLGRQVAIVNDPAECNSIISAGVSEALQELSEFEPEIPIHAEVTPEPAVGGEARSPIVGAPAGPDSKRVGRRRASTKQRE